MSEDTCGTKDVEANSCQAPTHEVHSHCVQCGAEAHGWNPDTRTWWCDRCASAREFDRLGKWFLDNFADEIQEGGLTTNVIRLLAEREDIPKLPKKDKYGRTTFNLICTMKDRWVPHFLAMLKYMQQLGSMGGTRRVTFLSDGDGDFNPLFNWDDSLPSDGEPVKDEDGNKTFDAG